MKKVQKKLLIALIIVAAISIIAAIIYFAFFFNPNEVQEQPNEINTTPQGRTLFPIAQPSGPDGNLPPGINPGENIPKLRQISIVPTSGSVAFNREKEETRVIDEETGAEETVTTTETVFRYIERGTGHMYETFSDNLTQQRVSNFTIPQIQDAVFSQDGEFVILRKLDDLLNFEESFLASMQVVNEDTGERGLVGEYIEPAIKYLDSNSRNYVYTTEKAEGGANFFSGSFGSSTVALIGESRISEWLIEDINNEYALITTKPTGTGQGSASLLNKTSGKTEQIISGKFGLTVKVSPDLKYAFFSVSEDNTVTNYVKNLETSIETKINGIQTMLDKCVWSKNREGIIFCGAPDFMPDSVYPDNWYLGLGNFDDHIFEIDVENTTSKMLMSSRQYVNRPFDTIKLELSPNEDFLLFINKIDLTLWALDIRD
jgi:hypothetical protein